jgi:hypothetical protein
VDGAAQEDVEDRAAVAAMDKMACTQIDKVPDIKITVVLVSHSSELKILSTIDDEIKTRRKVQPPSTYSTVH